MHKEIIDLNCVTAKSEAELEKEQLMRKIGELTVEIDFLKKRLP